MGERHLRVVRDDELPRTIVEYLKRENSADIASHLGGVSLWLWAADAYGIVTADENEADVVHCETGFFVPVEFAGMRRLSRVDDVNDMMQRVTEMEPPSAPVAVFRVRDEALSHIEWLNQSPDGVADYAEVGIAVDAPVTIIDDEEYERVYGPSFSYPPRLTVVKNK